MSRFEIKKYSEALHESDLFIYDDRKVGNFTVNFEVAIDGKIYKLIRQNLDLGNGSHFVAFSTIEYDNDERIVYDLLDQDEWNDLDSEAETIYQDLQSRVMERLKDSRTYTIVSTEVFLVCCVPDGEDFSEVLESQELSLDEVHVSEGLHLTDFNDSGKVEYVSGGWGFPRLQDGYGNHFAYAVRAEK